MSIFHDMRPDRRFHSWHQFDEVNRMLREAIERGHVEAITPLQMPNKLPSEEWWFRDKETGEIYRLVSPNPPAQGAWEPVDLDDYLPPNSSVQ
jgi:hypothetical protein